jgi:hypothetical protein
VRAGDAEPAPVGDVRPGARVTGATAQPKIVSPPKRAERVTEYADVDLQIAGGVFEITAVRRGRFATPTEIPRFRGHYRIASAHGKTVLTERDFDFPLLADAETDDQTVEAQKIGKAIRKNARATTTVRVPLLPEADQVVVTDPRTGRSVSRPLPSSGPMASPPSAAPPAAAARK